MKNIHEGLKEATKEERVHILNGAFEALFRVDELLKNKTVTSLSELNLFLLSNMQQINKIASQLEEELENEKKEIEKLKEQKYYIGLGTRDAERGWIFKAIGTENNNCIDLHEEFTTPASTYSYEKLGVAEITKEEYNLIANFIMKEDYDDAELSNAVDKVLARVENKEPISTTESFTIYIADEDKLNEINKNKADEEVVFEYKITRSDVSKFIESRGKVPNNSNVNKVLEVLNRTAEETFKENLYYTLKEIVNKVL